MSGLGGTLRLAPSCKAGPVEAQREPVESISAVTLLTVNMVEAVAFYQALGFHLLYGGEKESFTSFRVGAGYFNLQIGTVGCPRRAVWGRVVSVRPATKPCSGQPTHWYTRLAISPYCAVIAILASVLRRRRHGSVDRRVCEADHDRAC